MGKAAVKRKTTTPAKSDLERAAQNVATKRLFWSNALDMGWQLAVAVLVPVFIGVQLDNRFNTAPSWTLAALFIAIGASSMVVYNTLKTLNAGETRQEQEVMISALIARFAEESGPTVHIAPSVLTTFHGFIITNSMVFAWLCSTIIIIALVVVARRMTIRPKGGFTQIVEVGTEFIIGVLENSMGSRKKAIKYAPFFTALFFFIVFSNLLGLLPGVGEALTYHGLPVFRPFTADLNGTLAIATITLVCVQYFAIRESGPSKHLRHYFAGSLKNPLTYVAGLYEMLGEFIRLFSLALRLFLNVAIGEIIIAVFSYLGKFAAPITSLPFVMLEMGVGILQSYIFVMLSITYLSLSMHHSEGEEEDEGFDEAFVQNISLKNMPKVGEASNK